MNIIIPLNGIGKRFRDEGYDDPKPLIKIFEKELILEVLDRLALNQDNLKLIIIYNAYLDKYNFKEKIQDKYPKTILISLINQTDGAVQTILEGLSKLDKKYLYKKTLFIDCDTFYTVNLIDLCKEDNNNKIFYRKNSNIKPLYSYILMDENKKIIDIKEKTKISDNANTGAYFFNNLDQYLYFAKDVIDKNIRFNDEFYTTCVVDRMIENNINFYGIEIPENTIYSIGTPLELDYYKKNTFLFLFDLDGTLVLTDEIYVEVWNKLLQKFNIFITKKIFETFIQGNSDDTVLKTLLNVDDTSLLEKTSKDKDRLFLENLDKIKIIDGVINLFKNLRTNGQKIGIVTNCNREVAENIIKLIGIDKFIDILVIGNECEKSKPYPDPYLKAIEILNFDNKKTVIFEDSRSGIKSALSALPRSVIGIDTSLDKSELLKFKTDLIISNYNSLGYDTIINLKNSNPQNIIDNISNGLKIKKDKIKLDEEKLKGGYICEILSFIAEIEGKKEDLVVKIENNSDNSVSEMANKLDLYNREYYFYESILPEINIKVPKYYGTLRDENLNSVGVVMENLYSKNMEQGVDLNKEPIEITLKIIDEMTKFHSKFWNKDLKNIFPLLNKHNSEQFNPSWSNFVNDKKDIFIEKWGKILSKKDINLINIVSKNFIKIQSYLSANNLTLCHGDIKAPNIFFDKSKFPYEPHFIDWQYIAIGKGVQDLIFFMIESFDTEKININYNIFTNYYYAKLAEKNVKYDYDNFQKDLIFSMCYFPFYVAIWFGTTDADELIDKNFPFFFIKKLFSNYRYVGIDKIVNTI